MLGVLGEAADAVVGAFADQQNWGMSGLRPDQYVADLVADEAVLGVLGAAGIRVLSEESGLQEDGFQEGNGLIAVVDPLDGSTNASLQLGLFATSLCVVDEHGPWLAVVHDHPGKRRYTAIRGGGATLDGAPLASPREIALSEAVVAVNGVPPRQASWWQFRALGCCALELCAVAEGRFAGYVDFSGSLHVWDYLGALLVCSEVGVAVVDCEGRDLTVIDQEAMRSPVAAASSLLPQLLSVRRNTVD
ncbi:MAG: inositol monophosphatase [Acidimicrobiia bacterium]|nr:inositol monophosphatase [Acidimicrobiia bacterium]MCY4457373.1 inositol monophosphatase [Acidimicrobiaceae bacterium]